MKDIGKRLFELSKWNEKYSNFNKKIVNTKKETLWVRTPDLRKFAKELAKEMDYERIEKFLEELDKNIYEEIILFWLIITYAKLTDLKKIALTKKYLKLVDSWAEIDIFVSKMKKFDEKLWWDFVLETLKSEEEFTIRFWVIFMMTNFLNEKYISEIFEELRKVKNEAYYVKMWIAWFYATSAVKFYDETLEEIQNSKINSWTRNKALQKMLESFRFSDEQKKEIRELRKRLRD